MKYIYKGAILCLIMLSISTFSLAQLPIPSMDAKLQGGYGIITGMETQDFEGINISGALHFHINERIAVGPFFSRGVDMNFAEEVSNDLLENDAELSIIGLNVRLSASRSPSIRPYLNLSYFRMELIKDFGDYRLASQTNGFGAGLGLMIKLNRNLYLNAIELSARQVGDDAFEILLEDGGDFLIQLQTGISYNLGRKK